jgi:hypothetical protein
MTSEVWKIPTSSHSSQNENTENNDSETFSAISGEPINTTFC